jgi:hypothetical protein
MKIIKGYYPAYYRDRETINDAVTLWSKVMEDQDFLLIQKGLERFIKNDTKGFPPVPGQIITLAAEIRRMEWEEKQREISQLPEPPVNAVPMPDDLRAKLQEWLKGTEI